MSSKLPNIRIPLGFIVLLASACQSSPAVGTPISTTSTAISQSLPRATVATSTVAASPTPLPSPTSGPTPTPAPLRIPLWTFSTQGEVWSSPIVRDGVVYFGSDDHFLYAVDIATHQLKWKFETGGLVRSRPAVAGETVYFTSDDNYLYALDAQTGEEVWRFDMGEALTPRLAIVYESVDWDYQVSSPAVAEGIVYVGSANTNFYAVDANTGQEKWRFKVVMGPVRSSPAVVEGVVYFGDWYGRVYALDAQTGQEKWHFMTGDRVVPSPTIVDGVIYIGSKSPRLYALDAQTGQKIWSFSYPEATPWVESSAAVAKGVVYVGSAAWKRLNAIDAATGQLKWYFPTNGFALSSPVVADGVVYIGATGGYFFAVDADAGRELWRVETGGALRGYPPIALLDGGAVSSPAKSDGVIYFGSLDGKMYAVSTAP